MISVAPPSQRVELYMLEPNQNDAPEKAKPTVTAQYNPTSLQYTITNTAAKGNGGARTQKVDDSTAKLNLELIFDSTDTGKDVRLLTQAVAQLMAPNKTTKVQPKIRVKWGAFKFLGLIDSYKETIDFFSADGIPLRASVSLSLSSPPDKNVPRDEIFVFADKTKTAAVTDSTALGPQHTVEVRPDRRMSATDTATQAGDPDAGRDLAAQNGVEDMRDPGASTDTLLVGGDDADLLGPVAFASGSASAGFGASASAGFGAGASAGFGAGASAGFGAGASAGFGASASAGFGASASAGFGGGASAGFGGGASAGFGGGASAGFGGGASAGFGGGASFSGAGFGGGASAGFGGGASAGFGGGASAGFGGGASASFGGGASAGFGGSASASFGGRATASFGASASASFGASASARFGTSRSTSFASFGASGNASAGISASEGAFAFLRAPVRQPRRAIDPNRLIVRTETHSSFTSSSATFAVGGRVITESHSSSRTDVGQSTSLRQSIQFDGDDL